MKDKLANITRWILYLLMAVVIASGLLFYLDVIDSENFINIGKLLLIVGVAVMVISPIFGFITNPKNIVKMLISIAITVVVVVIGYSMASNYYTDYQLEELKTTAETSKMVGMGLYVTYIAFGLTILSALYASIVKMFK